MRFSPGCFPVQLIAVCEDNNRVGQMEKRGAFPVSPILLRPAQSIPEAIGLRSRK